MCKEQSNSNNKDDEIRKSITFPIKKKKKLEMIQMKQMKQMNQMKIVKY